MGKGEQPTRKTRGKGEGSIYPRCRRKGPGHEGGDHGRCDVEAWLVQVENGRYPNGKRRYARASRKTKAAALEALKELQRQVDAGMAPDRTRTVGGFLDYWLTDIAPGTIKDSTLEGYRYTVDHWVKPELGHKRLARLAPGDVAAMLRRLEDRGLSPNTRRLARAVLRRALAWAAQEGLVARNVAALTQGPRGVRSRIDDTLTLDETRAVLTAARGDRLEALAVVLLHTGLRRGEALALDWPSVDLDAGTFTVGPTLKQVRGRGLVLDDDGKTKAAKATLPLPAPVAAALKAHRRRQAEERLAAGPLWVAEPLGRDLVFRRDDGSPLSPHGAYYWWRKLCERAGSGPRRLHAARHTCATLMLDAGVPLEVVSAVLRHSGLAITANVYAKVTQDSKRRAMGTLEGLLGDA